MQIGIVVKYKEPDAEDYSCNGGEAYDAQQRRISGEDYGQQAHHRGYGIENCNGLLLAQAHSQKSVVEVPFVGVKGTLTVRYTAAEGKGRISERQSQGQHGHEEGEHCVKLEKAHY